MDGGTRSPMRYVAPLALLVATIVFLAVLAGGIDNGDEPTTDADSTGQAQGGSGGGGGGNRSTPRTYEVQEGDTLDAIAAQTGVSVDQIEALNPELDPQSLIAGQELKLRE